jgi:hypothetical protein
MSQYDFLAVSVHQGGEKVAETVAQHFPPVNTEAIALSREEMDYAETIGLRAPTEQEYGGLFFEGDIEGAVRPSSTAPFFTSCFGEPDSSAAVIPYAQNRTYRVGEFVIPSTSTGSIYVVTAVTGTGNVGTQTEPTWAAGPHTVTNSGNTVTFTNTGTTYAAGTFGTVKDHLWNPVASGKAPHPLTIWTVNNDPTLAVPPEPAIVDKYIGSYVNELALEVETNGYLTFAASMVALLNDETASAPALTRDLSFKFGFAQVTSEVSVAGGSLGVMPLQNFSWNYNNNFETDIFRLGSREPHTFRAGSIEVGAEFRPVELIASHYRRALLKSPEFVHVKLLAVGETLFGTGLSAIKRELEINLYRLQYLEAPVDINADEPLTGVDVTARGAISPTNQLVTVRMRNAENGDNYRA